MLGQQENVSPYSKIDHVVVKQEYLSPSPARRHVSPPVCLLSEDICDPFQLQYMLSSLVRRDMPVLNKKARLLVKQ